MAVKVSDTSQTRSGIPLAPDGVIELIQACHDRHRPSRHAFFTRLASYSTERLRSRDRLDRLYISYQAAMHSTRVMLYFLPHLDSISLRSAKVRIMADDDNLPDGDSHHVQLRKTWETMLGKTPSMKDDEFGELDILLPHLDGSTASFVAEVSRLYPRSLGPWLVIEGLAHDWIGALLGALLPHFPEIAKSRYFVGNLDTELELRHAEESLALVRDVLVRRPELCPATVDGARDMAVALDAFWDGLIDHLD